MTITPGRFISRSQDDTSAPAGPHAYQSPADALVPTPRIVIASQQVDVPGGRVDLVDRGHRGLRRGHGGWCRPNGRVGPAWQLTLYSGRWGRRPRRLGRWRLRLSGA